MKVQVQAQVQVVVGGLGVQEAPTYSCTPIEGSTPVGCAGGGRLDRQQ